MTKPSIGKLLGALAVGVPGSIATVIVLRTLPVYWGRDWTATAIVLTIAAALLLGLVELFVRQHLAQLLESEVRALPTRPREATLDIASPRLAALLRARLEHAPAPAFGEGITSFLTGLLVMLGLLGTLLGLYQTVQGAGLALTTSANVAALRHSLSGPIAGLTRSFGCSAAGISASAMLGLALALVRRREVRALRVVHAYAAGPLRTFSANARQLRAIEQLATQGASLPAAATAIASVGDKLGELTTRLLALQQTALDSQERTLRELIASVPGELAKAASETGEALQTHVAPLLDQLAARSGEALAAQSSALSGIALELTGQLDREAKQRRDDTAAALEALRGRLDEAERARATAHTRELAAVGALHSEAVAASARRDEALGARLEQLVTRLDTARDGEAERLRSLDAQLAAARASEAERLRSFDAQLAVARGEQAERLQNVDAQVQALLDRLAAQLAAARASETERLQNVDAQVQALLEGFDAQLAAARGEQAERLQNVDAQVQALLDRLDAQLAAARASEAERLRSLDAQLLAARERESQQLQGLDALSSQVGSELARLAGQLSAQLEQRQASERGHDARAEQAIAQLTAASTAVQHSAVQQEATLERLVERLPPLFSEAAESSQASTQRALDQLLEASERRISDVSQLFSDELAKRADETHGWSERALLALERVDRSADLLDDTIARQSQGMSDLLTRVAQLLPELSAAAQSGAVSTLSQLRELAEQQANRFVELERSVDRGREQYSRGFAEQLTGHAAELEQRLTRTSDAVHEAAAVWQASSAEMQAVAQLFANSVERQREASDAWLESLGQIEAAVEHAGRRSASDALADQLASTHELFARQLQFQRELFEQLRGLRGGAPAPKVANGGRSVSAGK